MGGQLARSNAPLPLAVLIRRLQGRRATAQAEVLFAHLPAVEQDLVSGSVVAIDEMRLRVRRLPFSGP